MKLRVSLFVLFVGLALAGCHFGGDYLATAAIEIRLREIIPIPALQSAEGMQAQELHNEFEVIESPDVLRPVITDLKLDRIWAERMNKGGVLPMEDALKYLTGRLKLTNHPDTMVINITVSSNVPNEAEDIANAIAYRYKALRDDAEEQLYKSGLATIRNQITQQEQVAGEAQAKAQQNPQDAKLQKQSQVSQGMLQTLRIKLEQDEMDLKVHDSPVRIISRAVPGSPW